MNGPMENSLRITCLRVWTHSLPNTKHVELSWTQTSFMMFVRENPLRTHNFLSMSDEDSLPHKTARKTICFQNSYLSRFAELEVTRVFASYLSPWPTDNQFHCMWNCPWTRWMHCCERLQIAAQSSLHNCSAGDVAATSRRTAFYGIPYLHMSGLKFVTQRYLDLSFYVHVQSLKLPVSLRTLYTKTYTSSLWLKFRTVNRLSLKSPQCPGG
jgi:hypothetical protein